jgi:hypothetical protein
MKCNATHLSITILFLTLSLSTLTSVAQTSPIGIYVSVKTKKRCENPVIGLDNKKVCLAPQPVLTLDDISHISPMKIDLANQSYFNLVFTEAGASKLRSLSIAFPNTKIVLVVDKTVVGVLKDLDVLKSNVLKMTGSTEPGKNLEFVYEKLKTALPVRK